MHNVDISVWNYVFAKKGLKILKESKIEEEQTIQWSTKHYSEN
jgi:hypothetical protein